MNPKILLVVFLCLFSASIICNVAAVVPNVSEGWSCSVFTHAACTDHIASNVAEPTVGDPVGGGGWP